MMKYDLGAGLNVPVHLMAAYPRCDPGGGADFRRNPANNPRVEYCLNRCPYVNSHVTFVAPRVIGQVARVLVDDNYRVKTGDVLVELDPEPYQVQVAIQQANVNSARANLVETQATVRGLVGQLRSRRFKLTRAIEDVDNQIALVRARVATAP
jgi:multidrug resistance efflux pump